MKKLFTVALIVYVVALLALSVTPGINTGSYDKAFHLIEFFILTALMLKTLSYYDLPFKTVLTFLVVIVLVVASELLQLYVPTRTFSFKDMIANSFGFFMAIGAQWLFSTR